MNTRRRLLLSLPLLLIAALAICEASGWFFLRAPAEAILASQTGREVHIAPPFRLHFRATIRLELGGLWISAPAEYAAPHLIDAQGLKLGLRYADMLALRQPAQALRLALLAAERIDARLIRLDDGRASWQFTTASARPPPTVDSLAIAQGRIVLRDAILAADLDARIAPRANDASPALGAEISGRFRERPLQASLSLPEGFPGALPGAADDAIAAAGKVDYGGLHLSFAGTFGTGAFRSTATISGPSLALLGRLFDVTLPTTAPFTLEAEVVKDSPTWQIALSSARVGRSDLAGNFTYDPRPQPPRLDGELTGRNFVLADLAPAFGTRNEDGGASRPAVGRTLPDRRLDLPSLTRLDAAIAVNLRQLDLGSAFHQPIAPLRARLVLDQGRMTLADIDASTAQGHLVGTLSIDARQSRPEWHGDLGWDRLRLDKWLAAAKAGPDDIRRRATGNPPPWFTGKLHGRAQLIGHGWSVAEVLGSLNGRATFFVRDGTFSRLALEALGLDIAQGLGLLLKGDYRQTVDCAIVDLDARNGRVTPRMAVVATPVTVVLMDGSLDFGNERLNLRLAAKPQNASPLTLRSPFHIDGSFAEPKLTVSAAPIAARAVGALGLSLLNPLAAIIPFIDLGERDTKACSRSMIKASRLAEP